MFKVLDMIKRCNVNMNSREAILYSGLTAGVALVNLANTAVRDHRVYTHESLKFNGPTTDRIARTMSAFLTDTKRWAAVHRIHHSTPDANLTPFVELADFLDWQDTSLTREVAVIDRPEFVYGLDPAATEIPLEVAREIGVEARSLVEGKYKVPTGYSVRNAANMLFNKSARFFYEDTQIMKKDKKKAVDSKSGSVHDVRFLLRDPHSPVLHHEGVVGILKQNVPLYGYVENSMADTTVRPSDLMPDEIDEKLRESRTKLRLGYVGGMMLAGVALNRTKTIGEVPRHLVLGAAASGLAVASLIAGGNITNAFGHAGDTKNTTLKEILGGIVKPKPDGTYTSNASFLNFLTLDEVGGQKIHHEHPDKVAYTDDTGIKKLLKAPFGTIVEALANKGLMIKISDNFGNDHRPDDPSQAVIMLQEERIREFAA
jgi:hypothetical protein